MTDCGRRPSALPAPEGGRAERSGDRPSIVSRCIVYAAPWFVIQAKGVVLPGESEIQTFLSVKPADYVSVVAVTRDGRLALVRQYRPVVEAYTLELPSGHVEEHESPEDAARRELLEETGCAAGEMRPLGCLIPDSGRLENRLWSFFAPDVTMVSEAARSMQAGIEVFFCTPEEVHQMVRNGQLNHALNLGILAVALLKGQLIL